MSSTFHVYGTKIIEDMIWPPPPKKKFLIPVPLDVTNASFFWKNDDMIKYFIEYLTPVRFVACFDFLIFFAPKFTYQFVQYTNVFTTIN